MSEDCLYLNVYTPVATEKQELPVSKISIKPLSTLFYSNPTAVLSADIQVQFGDGDQVTHFAPVNISWGFKDTQNPILKLN